VGLDDPSDQGLDVGMVRSRGGFCSTVVSVASHYSVQICALTCGKDGSSADLQTLYTANHCEA
jgi:hypothetical protein